MAKDPSQLPERDPPICDAAWWERAASGQPDPFEVVTVDDILVGRYVPGACGTLPRGEQR